MLSVAGGDLRAAAAETAKTEMGGLKQARAQPT
jgi:hypothetical protein